MIRFFLTLWGFLVGFWRGLRDREFRALFLVFLGLLLAGTGFYSSVEGWSLPSESDAVDLDRADTPPVNIQEFRDTLREAGVEDAVESMLNAFLHDAPGRMDDLESAILTEDAEQVFTAAHAFKSTYATIGARRLADLLKQVEAAGRAGDTTNCRALLDPVVREYQAVLDYLHAAI